VYHKDVNRIPDGPRQHRFHGHKNRLRKAALLS